GPAPPIQAAAATTLRHTSAPRQRLFMMTSALSPSPPPWPGSRPNKTAPQPFFLSPLLCGQIYCRQITLSRCAASAPPRRPFQLAGRTLMRRVVVVCLGVALAFALGRTFGPGARAGEKGDAVFRGKPLKEWVAALKDADPKVRRTAAEALERASVGSSTAVPGL